MDTDGTAAPAGAARAGSPAPAPAKKATPASPIAPAAKAAPASSAAPAAKAGPVSAPTPDAKAAPASSAAPDAKAAPVSPARPVSKAGPASSAAPVSVPPAAVRPVPATGQARAGASVPAQPAAPVPVPVPAPAPSAASPASRPAAGPRRARLLVTRLDPWSVMKTAFMLSVSIGIVLLMSTALLWWTLDVTGVFAAIGRTIDDVAGSGSLSFDFLSFVGFSRIMGIGLVLTAIEIVLGSALATLFAFLYNLSVGLTGGLEVTLSEDA